MKFEFQKLHVYQKAKAFHKISKSLIAQHRLNPVEKDQLYRASFSVPLNIAEGSGKFSKPDRKNYFTTARASVFECIAIADILCDQKVLSKDEYEELESMADELSRILYTMIKNLS